MPKIVLIKNFPNRAFAEQAVEILQQQNIAAILKGSDLGVLGTSSASLGQGVNLYVEKGFEDKARQYLNALYNGI